MNCPKCSAEGAYVGLNSVECKNPNCEHFCGGKDCEECKCSNHSSCHKGMQCMPPEDDWGSFLAIAKEWYPNAQPMKWDDVPRPFIDRCKAEIDEAMSRLAKEEAKRIWGACK